MSAILKSEELLQYAASVLICVQSVASLHPHAQMQICVFSAHNWENLDGLTVPV